MKYCMHFVTGIALTLLVSATAVGYQEKSELFYGEYSENYVNRWAIQAQATHVFDPRTNTFLWPTKPQGVTFDPAAVQPGDIIFVRDVGEFIKKLHPHIKHPYIMVTAGEYRDSVVEKFMRILEDEKVIAWWSVHACPKRHPKFHMLPLGVYQDKKYYNPRAELTKKFAAWRSAPKKGLLYSNFGDLKGMKPERAEVGAIFDDASYCFCRNQRLPFLEYMEEMSHYKFSLSPKGYGPDSYRNWEAMLVGSIPIVKTSHMDPLYEDLPVLIIQDWNAITEEYLEQKYAEMTAKKFNIEKLFMEYWWNKIQAMREAFLAKYKEGRE